MGNILLYFACKNIEIYLTEQRFISISKKSTKICYMIYRAALYLVRYIYIYDHAL
jgi:hypothetical protein